MSQHVHADPPHDIRDLIRGALDRNPCFAGRDVKVEFDRQDVILRGSVSSYYQKQVAQESLRRITGIGAIRNELEVAGA
jgi:osmotically-inducible protein OsmY